MCYPEPGQDCNRLRKHLFTLEITLGHLSQLTPLIPEYLKEKGKKKERKGKVVIHDEFISTFLSQSIQPFVRLCPHCRSLESIPDNADTISQGSMVFMPIMVLSFSFILFIVCIMNDVSDI